MDPVRFEVNYRFSEYRRFVVAHVRATDDVGFFGRMFMNSFLGELLFSALAAVAFPLKMRRVGTCTFTIDDDGLRRRSKDGQVSVSWDDVLYIHRYEPGYLIEKGHGAFPIPYRCLDAAQRRDLDALIAAHAPAP